MQVNACVRAHIKGIGKTCCAIAPSSLMCSPADLAAHWLQRKRSIRLCVHRIGCGGARSFEVCHYSVSCCEPNLANESTQTSSSSPKTMTDWMLCVRSHSFARKHTDRYILWTCPLHSLYCVSNRRDSVSRFLSLDFLLFSRVRPSSKKRATNQF